MADSFIEEIVDYLQAGGVGTKASTLFVSELPDDGDDDESLVVIQEFPGQQAELYTRTQTVNMGVTVRGPDYATARAKISQVLNRLHATTDIILEHSRVLYFACGMPGSIGQDDRGRQLVRMSLIARAHGYDPDDPQGDEGDDDSGDGGADKDPNPEDLPG